MNHECSAESELNPDSSCHEEVHLKLNTMSSFAELCIQGHFLAEIQWVFEMDCSVQELLLSEEVCNGFSDGVDRESKV